VRVSSPYFSLRTDHLPRSRRNNEKALFLLYNQLESEKERRVQSVQEEQAQQAAQDAEQ
jgi:hypothetical protein